MKRTVVGLVLLLALSLGAAPRGAGLEIGADGSLIPVAQETHVGVPGSED
jgi:hypothetical protein